MSPGSLCAHSTAVSPVDSRPMPPLRSRRGNCSDENYGLSQEKAGAPELRGWADHGVIPTRYVPRNSHQFDASNVVLRSGGGGGGAFGVQVETAQLGTRIPSFRSRPFRHYSRARVARQP